MMERIGMADQAAQHTATPVLALVMGAGSLAQGALAPDTVTALSLLVNALLAFGGAAVCVLGQMVLMSETNRTLSKVRIWFSILSGTLFGALLGSVGLALLSVWVPETAGAELPQLAAPAISGLIWPFVAEKLLRVGVKMSGRG